MSPSENSSIDQIELVSMFQVPTATVRNFVYACTENAISGYICSCGHPEYEHPRMCKVASYTCGCMKFNRYLCVSDVRPFYQISTDWREGHAFEKALDLALNLGVEIEHVAPRKCVKCDQVDSVLMVSLTRRGSASRIGNYSSAFICEDCQFRPKQR